MTLNALIESLNTICNKKTSSRLERLVFITDMVRIKDLHVKLARLAKSNIKATILIRDYDHPKRIELIEYVASLCKTSSNLSFSIGKDMDLALKYKANGIHLPEFMQGEIENITKEHPDLAISCACHNEKTLTYLNQYNIDGIFISPIFTTKSHPNIKARGTSFLNKLTTNSHNPAFALGGIEAENLKKLSNRGIYGIAGIDICNYL